MGRVLHMKLTLADYALLLVALLTPLYLMRLYTVNNSYQSSNTCGVLLPWVLAMAPCVALAYHVVTRAKCSVPAKVTAFLAAYLPATYVISRTYILDAPLSENFGLSLVMLSPLAVPIAYRHFISDC